MATVPGFIYLSHPRRLARSSNTVDNDLISSGSSEEDHNIAEYSNWGIPPGVWWKNENKWVRYDKKVENRIMKAEDIGLPTIQFNNSFADYSHCISLQHPSSSPFSVKHEFVGSKAPFSFLCDSTGGPEYEVDLVKMKEVHLKSGITRDIKIVRMPKTGCLFSTFPTSDGSTAEFSIKMMTSSSRMEGQQKYMVSWKDDIHGWCLYNNSCQRAIWSAWTKGDNLLSIKILKNNKKTNSTDHIIDLKRMQQINMKNGQKNPIKIAMWISSGLFPEMWTSNKCKYLAQEIEGDNFAGSEFMLYKLALSRMLTPEYVKGAISELMEPHTLKSLESSAPLDVAENDHWYRFLHAFMQRVKEIPDNLGHLWRFAINPKGHHHPENPFTPRNSNGLWRFMFAAPANGRQAHTWLKSVSGTFASSNDFHFNWFGLNSAITEFHCKPVSPGVVSMLVYLALMPKNSHRSPERMVAMENVRDYLLVASITVCVDDRTLGPAFSLWEDKNLGPAHSLWVES